MPIPRSDVHLPDYVASPLLTSAWAKRNDEGVWTRLKIRVCVSTVQQQPTLANAACHKQAVGEALEEGNLNTQQRCRLWVGPIWFDACYPLSVICVERTSHYAFECPE